MKYNKCISKIGHDIFRIACVPEGVSKIGATFAVRSPEKFVKAKTRIIKTSEVFESKSVKIEIVQDGKKFSSKNLKIEWKKGEEVYKWHPGKVDHENLGGAFLSLDYLRREMFAKDNLPYDPMIGLDNYVMNPFRMVHMINKHLKAKLGKAWDDAVWQKELNNFLYGKKPEYLDKWHPEMIELLEKIKCYPPGFLSKNGVSIFLDDSLPYNVKEDWIEKLSDEMPQILYFICFGDDYKKGIGYLTEVLGAVPEIPEKLFGIWFSCFRVMGEKDFIKVKNDFDKYDLPLDVVVVDTDWHKYLWHGFDWNKKLFPNPERFAQWLKDNKLSAAFNVHPSYIPEKDSRLPEYLSKAEVEKNILDINSVPHPLHKDSQYIDLFIKKQAEAYFKIFHNPIEKQGCDIWWIDGSLTDERGRESTVWLNEVYYNGTNKREDGKKTVVFSRTFGLGSHRCSIAFSADTFSQWETLEEEVIYTSKSANSLLAYVSHDIGGFIKGEPDWMLNKPPDALFIRWTQFGCLSPIMRFHSDHGVREPWLYEKNTLDIIRNFLKFRKCLFPYFRKLMDIAHDTGVALCMPMYYEFPNDEEAYNADGQYMLGEAMLVSPVVREDGFVRTWFPKGRWIHCFTQRIISGPAVIEEYVPLDVMPVYVREGYEIPYTTLDDHETIFYCDPAMPLAKAMGLKI